MWTLTRTIDAVIWSRCSSREREEKTLASNSFPPRSPFSSKQVRSFSPFIPLQAGAQLLFLSCAGRCAAAESHAHFLPRMKLGRCRIRRQSVETQTLRITAWWASSPAVSIPFAGGNHWSIESAGFFAGLRICSGYLSLVLGWRFVVRGFYLANLYE